MEECLEKLQDKIACREKEISTLYSLISSPMAMPSNLFVFGHSGTGKSLVVQSVLEYLNYNFVIINCVENPTVKHLLEHIVTELSYNIPDKLKKNVKKLSSSCNNMYEFIIHLKNIAAMNSSNIVLVFENCSRLRDMDSTLLPALLCLKQLSNVNIYNIFISDIAWEKFKIKNEMAEPIKIYFPQYSKEEVSEILLLLEEDNDEIDNEIYESYLNLFLSVYYRFCRDLNELRYMSRLNFKKYMEIIQSSKKINEKALWAQMGPIFKANLEVIYLRISADELDTREKLIKDMNSTVNLVQSFELPYYSKYMLIAAFLASYVPSKLDRHLFCKERFKKRKVNINKKVNSILMTAPHPFSIERMLGIFCFIISEDVDVNAFLLSQISTMCRLGLLTLVSGNKLDEPKYKCCIDFEFANVIAKMVNFDIQHILDAI